MKIFIKTLKGTSFEIDVKPDDTVAGVKRAIEAMQGSNVYPADQAMLIYQGKILKDDTTLEQNGVAEANFIVIMLSKSKAAPSGSTSAPAEPPKNAAPTPVAAPAPAPVPSPAPETESGDVYGQAASNLVAGPGLESTVQQLMDMGGGNWDRDTVIRALRAAFNNPERAVDYLYSGIPENLVPPPSAAAAAAVAPAQAAAAVTGSSPVQPAAQSSPVLPTGPNANPLDLFPRELPNAGGNAAGAGGVGSLEMLRNSPQFRALLALVQANPQILQPMLQELGKQNPQILRLIQENQAEFLRLINESSEGAEGDLLAQLGDAVPQAVEVTPEEQQALERLEAMGFNRELVLEVFFACNKNEELAANYLLDHMHEFEDEQQ
ncbi:hypothetical protein LUZ60_003137 [Juncus effusus]|nr:hypothetical protein LUZ60_003137 [Juncus effusus]